MPGQATYFADTETGLYLQPALLDVQIEAMISRYRLTMRQRHWEKCFQLLYAIDELLQLATEAERPVLQYLAS